MRAGKPVRFISMKTLHRSQTVLVLEYAAVYYTSRDSEWSLFSYETNAHNRVRPDAGAPYAYGGIGGGLRERERERATLHAA